MMRRSKDMPSYTALKAKQDDIESRKSKLLECFIPFRRSLLEKLTEFTKIAQQKGLQGVKLCKKSEDSGEILEATLTLNGFDLVFIATNDVFFATKVAGLESVKIGALTSKIFFYFEGSEDEKPVVEISVHGGDEESCVYYISAHSEDGPKSLTGKRTLADIRKASEEATETVIDLFYAFGRVWADGPTLGAMLKGKGQTRSLGFQISSK
jgi:hypothetical protein